MPVYVPVTDAQLQCAITAAERVMDELEQAAQAGPSPSPARNIAAYLKAAGITGYVGNGSRCPVANLIRKRVEAECGNRFEILVGQYVSSVRGTPFDNHSAVNTPQDVREFISAFDSGLFPELADNPFRTFRWVVS